MIPVSLSAVHARKAALNAHLLHPASNATQQKDIHYHLAPVLALYLVFMSRHKMVVVYHVLLKCLDVGLVQILRYVKAVWQCLMMLTVILKIRYVNVQRIIFKLEVNVELAQKLLLDVRDVHLLKYVYNVMNSLVSL